MSLTNPEQISASLAPAARLAEQGFLAAGRSLEGAIEILDRLTTGFATFVAELTGGTLDDIRRDLAETRARIETLANASQSPAAALEPLGQVVAAIDRRVNDLRPRAREVETLSLSARVVAGAMGDAGADFLVFSASIKGAAHRARSSLQDLGERLGLMDQDLRTARADAAAFTATHGETVRSIPVRLAANLRGLTSQQGLAADAATAAHRRSDDVRQQVSSQIVALQLGDITRQRLEHVEAAGRLLSGVTSPGTQIRGLLAAQLRDTAETLKDEGERIESRLTHLATAAHEIGRLGSELHGRNSTSDGGFVAALEADIRRIVDPLTELRAADATIDQHMVAVLTATEHLGVSLASLQSVEEDIRIMGLNATLKCGRLGAIGRPLAVVAQELRACGARFAGDAEATLRDLNQLRTLAAGLRDPGREARHAALAKATDSILASLRRLVQLENEMVAALARLQADAAAVGRLVEEALAGFSVRHALAATILQAADGFAAPGTQAASPDPPDLLDRITEQYTMAREREVHARFAPVPRKSSPAPDDALADVLF